MSRAAPAQAKGAVGAETAPSGSAERTTRAESDALEAGSLQAGLRLGAADDRLEREADRAAARALRGEAVGPLSRGAAAPARKCAACAAREEGETLQRACAECGAGGDHGRRAIEAAADATRGGGRPLSAAERAYFEPRFGRSFGAVEIHDDAPAHAAARGIGARAYALGRHVAFAAGAYAPGSDAGRALLAHELAHTVQQSAGDPPRAGVDRSER